MSTLEWEPNNVGGWRLREVDGHSVTADAYLSIKQGFFYMNGRDKVATPEGVTDIEELKAWALAIYRMS